MKFFVLLSFFALVSCRTLEYRPNYLIDYRESILVGKCEEAQNQIPLEKDETQFFRFYSGSVGYLAYVSTLPVTVGLDLLLLGRCRYICNEQGKPIIEFIFPTSSYTYENFKDMRCPDTSYYVQKFLEISECYEKRATRSDLEKSLSQLKYVEDDYNSGPSCIKIRDVQVVKRSRERVKGKLKVFNKKDF